MNKRILALLLLSWTASVVMGDLDKINWKDFMSKVKWGTNELIESYRPYVEDRYPRGNVSRECTDSLISYVEALREWKPWAVHMFDFTGKIPSSFKRGASIEFGSYDDCLTVQVDSSVRGQFCMVHVHSSTPYFLRQDPSLEVFKEYISAMIPESEKSRRTLHLHLGACVPSTCSEQDLYHIIKAFTKSANVSVGQCEVNESKKLSSYNKYALCTLSCLIILCLTGTALDLSDRKREESAHVTQSFSRVILKAFSLLTSSGKVDEEKNSEIRKIGGVMFLICVCLITCNAINYPTRWKEMRYTNIPEIYMAVKSADISIVAMDAAFFTSGFLSILVFWKNLVKTRGTELGLFRTFFNVVFRMTPVHAFTILLTFLLSLVYYGPLWNQTWGDELKRCQENAWLNLLNAQTSLPTPEICWLHTWYVALGFQFFLASLPLVWLLFRYPKFGVSLGLLIICGCAVHSYGEVPFQIQPYASFQYFELSRHIVTKFYSKPLCFLMPYLFGMLAASISINCKHQHISKVIRLIGWCLSVAALVSALNMVNYLEESPKLSSLDIAKRTMVTCLALAWMMHASIVDGFVGRVLSSDVLMPFSRVTMCAYFVHPLLLVLREAALKERIYIGKLSLTIEATSLVICSFMVAFAVHLLIEVPFTRLYELLTSQDKKSAQRVVCSEEKLKASWEQDETLKKTT